MLPYIRKANNTPRMWYNLRTPTDTVAENGLLIKLTNVVLEQSYHLDMYGRSLSLPVQGYILSYLTLFYRTFKTQPLSK